MITKRGCASCSREPLFHMNEEYAQGVLQSLGELISAGVPEAARRQIGSPFTQEGASDDEENKP
jgi:hypothetical protein